VPKKKAPSRTRIPIYTQKIEVEHDGDTVTFFREDTPVYSGRKVLPGETIPNEGAVSWGCNCGQTCASRRGLAQHIRYWNSHYDVGVQWTHIEQLLWNNSVRNYPRGIGGSGGPALMSSRKPKV
jgi:hypothetical protein